MGAIDRIVSSALPAVPGFLVRSVGRRYAAGESLDDALEIVRDLRSGGRLATVDVLGEDVRSLAEPGAAIRLCKGIYPEKEAIAFQDPDEIRASYVRSLETLLGAGSYAGIATHDDALVDAARDLVERRGIPAGGYEFQMLLGVRPELGRALVAEGRTVRVYVPYGADWEAYCVRRLRENPEIAGHVLGALFRGQ